jgi:hypothetical protein
MFSLIRSSSSIACSRCLIAFLLAARALSDLVVLADYVPVAHRPVGAHAESPDVEVAPDVELEAVGVQGSKEAAIAAALDRRELQELKSLLRKVLLEFER